MCVNCFMHSMSKYAWNNTVKKKRIIPFITMLSANKSTYIKCMCWFIARKPLGFDVCKLIYFWHKCKKRKESQIQQCFPNSEHISYKVSYCWFSLNGSSRSSITPWSWHPTIIGSFHTLSNTWTYHNAFSSLCTCCLKKLIQAWQWQPVMWLDWLFVSLSSMLCVESCRP